MSLPRRPRVLLADDHPGMISAIGQLLALDCEVAGTFDNCVAVIGAAKQLQPDVIVLDLNMPNVSGLDACRLIAQTMPHVKVVMLSAAADTVVMQAAFAAGASAFLEKQDIADELPAVIKRLCADRPL